MGPGRGASAAARALYPLTAFTGAALVFSVQPMVARQVLPALGGSPEVWSVCLAFSQLALLAGYGWAWALTRVWGSTGAQVAAHAVALFVALAWLPLGLDPGAGPGAGQGAGWLLMRLLASVGPPVAVAAATAPLLQTWLAGSGLLARWHPRRLYAASNLGSLAALLAYPVLLEPVIDLSDQLAGWSLAFGALVALILVAGGLAHATPGDRGAHHARSQASRQPLALPALVAITSTSLLLALTLHLASDVGSVPLLWVLPLAAWLLTWVVAFGEHGAVATRWARRLVPIAGVGLGVICTLGVRQSLPLRLSVCLAGLVVLGVALHGRLAALAPDRQGIARFYLAIAAGGAVGGMFNSFLAPVLFDSVVELPLAIVAGMLLGRSPRPWVVVVAVIVVAPTWARPEAPLWQERTFFGVLRVEAVQVQGQPARRLVHGSTEHGTQLLGHPAQATTYYSSAGPLGDILRARSPGPIAAVGLGVGTLVAGLGPEDTVDLFELDPAVARIAQGPWFSYLRDTAATTHVIVADGRRGIAAAPQRDYSVVVLDAFGSDAVPTHLLTVEAMGTWLDHLGPGGLIAVHATSWYVDLPEVLAAVAQARGLASATRLHADARPPARRSQWVVLARDAARLQTLLDQPGWHPLEPSPHRAWTDERSPIVRHLKWGGSAR